MGWERFAAVVPYGDRWRKYRKLIHQTLHKTASEAFWMQQQAESRRYIGTLLDTPQDFIDQFRL
jgi:cytochrome P450